LSQIPSVNPSNKVPRRPRWSLKANFLAALGLLVLVVSLILFLVEKSLWVRLELITAVLSFFMFVYLWLVLYHGVRFDKRERYQFRWVSKNPSALLDAVQGLEIGGTFAEAGAEGGPLGLLIGFLCHLIISILLVVLIAFIFWLSLNLLVGAVVAVFIPLFFLFSRSLRLIVSRGRRCRGDLRKSLSYAIGYTLLSTIWLYLILFSAHYIVSLTGRVGG